MLWKIYLPGGGLISKMEMLSIMALNCGSHNMWDGIDWSDLSVVTAQWRHGEPCKWKSGFHLLWWMEKVYKSRPTAVDPDCEFISVYKIDGCLVWLQSWTK